MRLKAKRRVAVDAARCSPVIRALRKLSGAGMSLCERRDGEAVEFFYVCRGARGSLGAGKVASTLAMELRTRGLIKQHDGAWITSEAGWALLQRAENGELGFLAQHMKLERVEIGAANERQHVVRNAAESPLAWLRSRKGQHGQPLVGDAQYEAGERLRRDFTRAQLMPRLGMRWEPFTNRDGQRSGQAGGQAEMAAHVLDARARVNRALSAVGCDFANVLIDVCCLLRGLESVESEHGWPRRSGKLVLQLALNALARHYGLIAEDWRPARHPMRHWGGEGYRPSME